MNKEQILDTIKGLAKSQGFYGRLLEYITDYPDYLDYLESLRFGDKLDLILYLEEG